VIVFILLAIVGLMLSVLAQVSTFFGVDLQDRFSYFWLLHIGIFVVWIPAVLLQPRAAKRSGGKWLAHAPRWSRAAMPLLIGYCVINFVLFVGRADAGLPQTDGKGGYELRNHGRLVRTITAAEYHAQRAYEVRAFSSTWILFYGIAAMVLMTARNERAASIAHASMPAAQANARTAPVTRSPPTLNYGRSLPAFAMPIWLHATLGMMLLMAGWIGGPALMGLLVLPHLNKGANAGNGGLVCPMIILLVGSALCGALVPRMLLRRLVPSRCPSCGGRADFSANDPMRYRCRDCGREHEIRP
jgi:DNA-directed RNA polymerase subunit RPC12/RpoP